MKITGTVSKITKIEDFIKARLQNKEAPGSFVPISDVKVELRVSFNIGGLPISQTLVKSTNGKGEFDIGSTKAFPADAKARLVVKTKVGEGLFHVPIYAPIYRSETFKLSAADKKSVRIFIFHMQGDPKNGVSQSDVNALMQEQKKANKMNKLSGSITSDRVKVKGERDGADVVFDITLAPSFASDLDEFVSHKVVNFDIDLPGPDFLVGLCVDEDEIETKVKKGIDKSLAKANKDAKDDMVSDAAKKFGIPAATLKTLLDTQVSITVRDLDFPVTDVIKIPGMPIEVKLRTIVFHPSLGFPRKAF